MLKSDSFAFLDKRSASTSRVARMRKLRQETNGARIVWVPFQVSLHVLALACTDLERTDSGWYLRRKSWAICTERTAE